MKFKNTKPQIVKPTRANQWVAYARQFVPDDSCPVAPKPKKERK